MRDTGAEEGRGVRARQAERRESRTIAAETGTRRGKESQSVSRFPYCSIVAGRPLAVLIASRPILHCAHHACVTPVLAHESWRTPADSDFSRDTGKMSCPLYVKPPTSFCSGKGHVTMTANGQRTSLCVLIQTLLQKNRLCTFEIGRTTMTLSRRATWMHTGSEKRRLGEAAE